MPVDLKEVDGLLKRNIEHLAEFRQLSREPIENAASFPGGGLIPIPFFGDPTAYSSSEFKILTVGLNPSNREFQRGARERRWSPRFNLNDPIVSSDKLPVELKNYFKVNPYGWFNSFEDVLRGCNATYGFAKNHSRFADSILNFALHIDVCSPIATNPTWSKLGVQNPKDRPQKDQATIQIEKTTKEELTSVGKLFFKIMLQTFKPDIVIASVGWSHLETIECVFFNGKN